MLSLEDNAPVSGAWAKGRSSSVGLNFLLRRRTALALAADLHQYLPWVQTEHMPADWLSRLSAEDAAAVLGPGPGEEN